ncbi:hypothetical protein BM525_21225 (plasmid) [Alteromonas mediterranea]|uniref:PIN domain-containing protein n=1 Tax=Alteromonas mediterranea TaxID=314275 RepID=A0AAC9JIG3_9ALTE|nr:hypothetical protein BM524_21005 [Alteromonas mediterranea]APE00364.1 hypothetical protein BM525_21225 [Alteromonas mediterranea]
MANTNTKRLYLLDTNVLVSDPHAIFKFDEHDVVISMTVLEELDKLKSSNKDDMVRKDARIAIQNLKRVMSTSGRKVQGTADLYNGIPIPSVLSSSNSGRLRIVNDHSDSLSHVFNSNLNDNMIIATAVYLQSAFNEHETVLVTKDINMQIKAWAAGVKNVEDYMNDRQIDDADFLASGYEFIENDMMHELSEASPMEVTGHHDRKPIYLTDYSTLPGWAKDVYLNKVFIGEGSCNNGNVLRVIELNKETDTIRFELNNINRLMNKTAYGVSPRNVQQALALDALLDPNISLVILTGPAGSGKTLVATSASLHQCEAGSGGGFKRVIMTRSTTDMTDSIGFTPGDETEKMMPWLGGFTDALEYLTSVAYDENDSDEVKEMAMSDSTMNMVMQKSNVQFKSMNYMRGRSLSSGTFLLLDEAQNLTPSHVKSMLTRMSEGSKIVIMGNLAQIDSPMISAENSGLSAAVETMKHFHGAAVFNLPGGQRGELSAYAEDNM